MKAKKRGEGEEEEEKFAKCMEILMFCMDSMIFGMDFKWKARILWFSMDF